MASVPKTVDSRRVAIILCVLPSLYFAATTAYALLNFDSYASDTPQFLRYVAVPAGIALLFVVCGLRLSGGLAATIGMSGLAVLAGLFLFELVLSIRLFAVMIGMFGVADSDGPAALRIPNSLPPGATTKALNRELGPAALRDAMLGGIPYEPVLLCSRDGKPVVYQADRFGFNNPDTVYRSKVDVVIVGDSFVEGHCLPPGRDLVSRIRAGNPATVGLGMRGGGPLFELAMLGRFGAPLRPRAVVVAFFEGNDWDNLRDELATPRLRTALRPDVDFGPAAPSPAMVARAKAVIREWDGMTATASDVLGRTQFVRNFLALQQTALQLGIFYPQVAQPQPAYRDVLRRTKLLTESWGGELVLLYIPRTDRFRGLLPQDFAFDRLRGYVQTAAADAGVKVVDLTTVFHQQADPKELYAPDSHLSERGAAVAARAVLDAIAPPGGAAPFATEDVEP